MIVKKLSRKPPHTFMAQLLDSDHILHEDGNTYRIEDTPKQTRIWSHWDMTVENIWREERKGEVLVYDQEPSRWRKTSQYEDHRWPSISNNQDVYLLRTPSYPEDIEDALQAFVEWRDWIEDYGGNAFGTIASVSWSLWRATLKEDFYTPSDKDSVTQIRFPIGGRLVPCKELNSSWVGTFVQWDLQAAYATELSTFRFGGKGSGWITLDASTNYMELATQGIPVYVKAKIWIPKMRFGPLPRRRLKYTPFSTVPILYGTSVQVSGTWTAEEVYQASLIGCSVKVDKIYMHVATGEQLHFLKWWKAIEDGRNHLEGFAKFLAKSTGNSLWGQFALRNKGRKIRWVDTDGKRRNRVIEAVMMQRPGAPEISDQLTGKVRAKLYEMMMLAGNDLMQANTDGAWVAHRDSFRPPDGWREKHRASAMEFIDESSYRYYKVGEAKPTYVMAGTAFDIQEIVFNGTWEKIHE